MYAFNCCALLSRAFTQASLVATHSLHFPEGLKERGNSTLSVKEPSPGDAESSGQPLTTAVFLPAGSSRSLARAGSPHCLWRRGDFTLPLSFSPLFPYLSLCPCHHSKNFHAVQSDDPCSLSSSGKQNCLHHFLFQEAVSLSKGPGGGRRKGWKLGTGLISDAISPEVKCY